MDELDVQSLLGSGRRFAVRAGDEAYFASICVRAGMLGLESPKRMAKIAMVFERYGLLSASVPIGALRNGDRVAIRDELGDLTYRELDEQTNALANAWRARGLQPGDGIAILARNHRGFLQAVFAAAKSGAKIILLNTSFAGPQIREVAQREGTDMLVFDDEYGEMLGGVEPPRGRWRSFVEANGDAAAPDTLQSLIASASTAAPPKSGKTPRIVILTSGTTGTPKGARRAGGWRRGPRASRASQRRIDRRRARSRWPRRHRDVLSDTRCEHDRALPRTCPALRARDDGRFRFSRRAL